MKLDRMLSPPLAFIESRLFGVSEALMSAVEQGKTSAVIAESVRQSSEWAERTNFEPLAEVDIAQSTIEPIEMPAHLRELIRRRLNANAAMRLDTKPIPTAGQIVEVTEIKTPRPRQLDWIMQVPLYVLLDAPAESDNLWHGWLVSGEADYAGWFDFVLQEEDEPFVPEAGVVQLWNPVRIYLPMATRAVGRLSPARLQAVRALAAEYVANDTEVTVPVCPGRVAARFTTGGLAVATGSPLGGENDPRHGYQQLYFHAAEAIREPARLALAELASEDAPNIVLALLNRLLAGASKTGQTLTPVPRVAVAMNAEDSERDIEWPGLARIAILRIAQDGSGQLSVNVISPKAITCELRVGGVLENKVTVGSSDGVVRIDWDAAETTILKLMAENNQTLELVLLP